MMEERKGEAVCCFANESPFFKGISHRIVNIAAISARRPMSRKLTIAIKRALCARGITASFTSTTH